MPFEIMVIVVVSVVSGLIGLVAITKMLIGFVERRRLGSVTDNSLTRAELSAMIADAVHEATQPLQSELERVQAQLPAKTEARLLEEHAVDPDERPAS